MVTLPNGATISLKRGDITTVSADAIVNAANAYLVKGGGVSAAIHAAAGPRLADECDLIALKFGPLKPGESVITGGYDLPAAHVIHSLGPVWRGGGEGEANLLANTYRSAMRLADQNELRSIAFPSISTGVFGYPLDKAAPIAIETVSESLRHTKSVREVMFVLFSEATFEAFASALSTLGA